MSSKKVIDNKFRAKVFKALSDPTRIQILDFLRDGEKCVCEIIPHVGLIQPVVSRHLKILKDSGLLKDKKDGNKRLYSVTDDRIFLIIDSISSEFTEKITNQIMEQII